MVNLPLCCKCGAVTGIARDICSSRVNRVVCYCSGCQVYAHALGRYEEIVDEYGGTDVFHMSPRDLDFFSGVEHLACMRMTEKGALRWYAQCCHTPIAHTLASLRLPFMAVNHICIDWDRIGLPRETVIGPVRAKVNLRPQPRLSQAVRGTKLQTIHRSGVPQISMTRIARTIALVKMLIHYFPAFMLWLVRGDAKHSPFIDAHSGKLIATPKLRKQLGNKMNPEPRN